MNVRRAMVVGIGKDSLPTLQKLYTQLQERHGGIPVIALLLITPECDTQECDTSLFSKSFGHIKTSDSNPTIDYKIVESLTHAILQQHVGQELLQRNITVNTNIPIEYIVVGNLDDTFVATNILALSQSIYPILGKIENNSDQESIAILGLSPKELGEVHQFVSDALQHINTYLERQKNRNYLVNAENRAIKKIYLLETTNSANVAVKDIRTLLWMAGDWIYYYLTSNIVPTFNSPNIHTFASFGYASLFVPEPQMRQVLVTWFLNEAFQDYLLAKPGVILSEEHKTQGIKPDHATTKAYFRGHVTNDITNVGLTEENLRNRALTKGADVPTPQLNLKVHSNKPMYLYRELEQEVARDYVYQVHEVLEQQVQPDQIKEREETVDFARTKIFHLRTGYLDKAHPQIYYSYTPLRTAEDMLELIAGEWERRRDEQRERISALETDIQNDTHRIRQQRSAYWDSALIFAAPAAWLPVPFLIPLFGLFLGLLVMGYLALVVHQLLGQTMLAWVLFVFAFALSIVIPIIAYGQLSMFKNELLTKYQVRLHHVREQNEAIQLYKLYKRLVTETQQLQSPITQAITQLNAQLATPVDLKRGPPYGKTNTKERKVPEDLAQALYGIPNYELEVSVVEEQDVQQWYKELFLDVQDVQAHVLEFIEEIIREGNPLSKRLDNNTIVTLYDDLQAWTERKKLHRLRKEPIERYLKKYSKDQQYSMLDLMIRRAHIYARINFAAAQDPEHFGQQPPDLEKHHVRVARQDKQYIDTLLEYIDRDRLHIAIKETEDPLRVDTVSVLNWVPLNSIELARRLQITGTSDTPHMGDIQLRDSLTQHDIDMYEIVALACALDVLRQQNGQFGYDKFNKVRSMGGEEHPYDFQSLGATFLAVVAELRNPVQSENRKAIHALLIDTLTKNFEQDNGKKLGELLYQRLNESTITEEKQALTDYLGKLYDKQHSNTV